MSANQSLLEILIRTTSTGTGAKDTASQARELKGGLGDLTQGLLGVNLASLTFVGVLVAVGKGLLDCVQAAGEAEMADARLEAVIKATGNTTGMTAGEMDLLAKKIMYVTGESDELVKQGIAMLATFGDISGDVFPRAIQVSTDMAAVLGGDLTTNIMKVGRLLEDPIASFGALTRQGIIFTESQKATVTALINTGQTAKAQAAIMDVLEGKFGGAAEMMGNTLPGQVKKLQMAFDELKESVGKSVVQILHLDDAVGAITTMVTWQEKINDAVKEHEAAMRDTLPTYEQYVEEMVRANLAAQGNETALADYMATWDQADLVGHFDLASRAAYDNAQNTRIMADAQRDAGGAVRNLADDLKKALDVAKGGSFYEMIANMYQLQLAADGTIGPEDIDRILAMRNAFGLLSDDEEAATRKTLEVIDAMNKLPSDKRIDVWYVINMVQGNIAASGPGFYQNLNLPSGEGVDLGSNASSYERAATGGKPQGGAIGLDIVVPPGYFENYPVVASSGERVKVEPEAQRTEAGGGRGGGVVVQQMNIYKKFDEKAAADWLGGFL